MANHKRYKKGQIAPADSETLKGSENHAFVINEKSAIKDKFNSEKMCDNTVETFSAKKPNAIEIISNLRTELGRWKSYSCSRRVGKRKTNITEHFSNMSEDESNRDSCAGLGLDDSLKDTPNTPEHVRKLFKKESTDSEELIHYFCQSKKQEKIDLECVHSLLTNGANINFTDKYGQTVLHEVARVWHVDVAKFLIEHGADVNKKDNFGRTPLHVAAAVDCVEMIDILIDNKADKEARTLSETILENQTPVFYAAKTDSVKALKTLILKHGCLYKTVVDYKGRTPIHVAAELDRSVTARLLLECDAPVYLSDKHGSRAITWMISKMAPVAKEGLNQFYSSDRANRKQQFALNYLVCDKVKDSEGKAPTPFHMAVGFKQYDLLMHPVFRKLLNQMWHQFGRFWALYYLGINLVYILMWTIIGILVEYDKRHIYTMPDDVWRIILYFVAAAFTLYQIFEEVREFKRSQRMHSDWEIKRSADIAEDIRFCHRRWPEEQKYLEMEMKILSNQKPKYFHDMWNIFDWICYLMLLICIATHVADIISHTDILARLHIRFMTVTIILLWLRLMKNARAFSILGPFIVMLGHMLKDCLKFLFLYMEFYIPYLAAFWMTFGGTKKVQNNQTVEVSVSGFEYPGQIFFSLFRLTLVDDYDYDNMLLIDSVMADILLATWFMLSAILCLNLFIALLSDTFQRVYDNAQANAVMQKAIMILNIWEGISKRRKDKFLLYIENNCSPLKEEYDDDLTTLEEDDLKKVTMQIKDDLDSLKEMFILQFGDPKSELSEINSSDDGSSRSGSHLPDTVISVNKLQSELHVLRESLKYSNTQQENASALLHKDMKLIKKMLKQLLESTTTDVPKSSAAVPVSSDASPHSGEQTPLSKLKKKKRIPMSTGLEIDTIDDGYTESTTLDARSLHSITEFSPAIFQNITHSAESQVFDVALPSSAFVKHLQQKSGTNDGSSTNC